jgi:hypothetical protein
VAITNGYASLNEVKAALKIIDGLDDSLLEMAIESASRLIDGYAGRYFYNGGTAVKNFAAQDWWITQIEDLQSITELASTDEVGGTYTTWGATDYQLEPLNSRIDGLVSPYTRIRAVNDYAFPINNEQALVKVTGVWGWASVPIAVKQATIIQASRIFKRLDSPLGVAGFGDMGVVRVGSRLDPDVQHLIDPYRSMRNFA